VKVKTEECPDTKCVVKEEPCGDCPSKRCGLLHRIGCSGGQCPDNCGPVIIMEGTGPAMTVPDAEAIAPPKNLK
jgi:hypothetical protein